MGEREITGEFRHLFGGNENSADVMKGVREMAFKEGTWVLPITLSRVIVKFESLFPFDFNINQLTQTQ